MDLVRVASLLGHSDIRTAQKYYLKKMRTAEDCSVGRTALLIQQMKNSNEGVGTQMARSNQILDLSDLVKSETPCVTGGFDGAPAQI